MRRRSEESGARPRRSSLTFLIAHSKRYDGKVDGNRKCHSISVDLCTSIFVDQKKQFHFSYGGIHVLKVQTKRQKAELKTALRAVGPQCGW